MALSRADKENWLIRAVDIAKAAAGSGGSGGCGSENLAAIIQTTYKKMVELAEAMEK